jgi:membrane protease YdiL (CAAX protease family)
MATARLHDRGAAGWAVAGYAILLAAFWLIARHFGVLERIGAGVTPAFLSFAMLLAPYWGFGFGLDQWLATRLSGTGRTMAPLALIVPYLVFALPAGVFRWDMLLGITALAMAFPLLLRHATPDTPGWRDWLVLAILGISVDLRFFDQAFPLPGLNGMAKLLFVDAGLYGYLIIRPIGGVGFEFRPCRADWAIGLREFLFYAPIAITLGFILSFLHFHAVLPSPTAFGAGWLFTLFFVAIPEELFFRGLLLNLLARRIGTGRALAVTSLLFGLAHFNKRAAWFNWRYVILAAIAGVFYGRAWRARRRVLTSSITHATVDTVWSIWLR